MPSQQARGRAAGGVFGSALRVAGPLGASPSFPQAETPPAPRPGQAPCVTGRFGREESSLPPAPELTPPHAVWPAALAGHMAHQALRVPLR